MSRVRPPFPAPTRRFAQWRVLRRTAHRRATRPKGLDRSPGHVHSAPLSRRKAPPLGYFAETPRAASNRNLMAERVFARLLRGDFARREPDRSWRASRFEPGVTLD